MASGLLNPDQHELRELEWARLIPGEMPAFRRAKKPAQSVRLFAIGSDGKSRSVRVARRGELWNWLMPSPLHSRGAQRWLTSTIGDFALVGLTWLLAYEWFILARTFFPQLSPLERDLESRASWLGLALLQAALITLVAHAEGRACGEDRVPIPELGKSAFLATTVLGFAGALHGFSWLTSLLVCVMGLATFAVLCVRRLGNRWTGIRANQNRNVLIVGGGHVGRHVASCIARSPRSRQSVCGLLDDEHPLGDGVIGRVSELARISRKYFIDEIILAGPHDSDLTAWVIGEAERLRLDVEIVPDLFGFRPANDEIERVGDLPSICLRAEKLPAAAMLVKRWIDVLGAIVGLITCSPLLILIAALIKMDSRGPVLYCAQRAGRKGKLFRCYKFRTMAANADEMKSTLRERNERNGPTFKIAHDPRITKVGRYLRRFSLDELPQLWNVLIGDMSLVGPRPHPLDDVAAYEMEHLGRLDVTPGLTGLWQVIARKDPSFQRGMDLDREYIRTWSLGLDARIVFRTVLAIAQGSGE